MLSSDLIVPLDGSTRAMSAVRVADRLAGLLHGGSVRLVSVVSDEREVAIRRSEIERLTDSVTDADVVSIEIPVADDPGDALAGLAAKGSICMTTSTRLRRHDGHFGSFAERVLHSAESPVIVLGPHSAPSLDGVERLIVPVDGSDEAERSVPVAENLASLMAIPLWVATVIHPEQAAAAAKAGTEIESGYVRRLARHAGDAQFETLHGTDPVAALLDFAAEGGMMVMSTHGRTGLRRLVAGSVTMGVVADAKLPVVVVPPGCRITE